MVFFGIGLLLLLIILTIAACAKFNICDSRMRMLNADWLSEDEKFRLVARWGRL